MDCSIMHSPPDHKQGSQHSHEEPVSQLEVQLHVGTFLLSALHLLVQKPQCTHRGPSLCGTIGADIAQHGIYYILVPEEIVQL